MKKIFLLLLIPLSSFGACPPESLEVEYVSPVTHLKKVTCGYWSDGTLIKHGPETEFDKDEKILRVTEYNKGKEGKALALEKPKNLPGAEESRATDEAFQVIQELLKVLAYDKNGINEGQFNVGRCDPKPKEWVIAAMTKKDFSKEYVFNERCDVSGNFTASFKNPFPVSFQLRHLKEFLSTAMIVKMNVHKSDSGQVRYRFEADSASVSAPQKMVEFKAWYEVDIDPMTGVTKFDTQSGSMTLVKAGDKVLNIERPLLFNR